MPKSRRDRKVTLSKTKKKPGLESKQALVARMRTAADEHDRAFVFSCSNMRNAHLKDVRERWKPTSAFFLGKNRVMALAMGRTDAEEYADGLAALARLLRDQRGVMFTSAGRDEVLSYFSSHAAPDFQRTGARASSTVTLSPGPMEQFPHSMEPQLRQLGLPTALKKGVVHLLASDGDDEAGHVVCREGEVLTSEQARILKLLGRQEAKFKLNMIAVWEKSDGKVTILKEEEKENGEEEEEEEDMSE